MTRTMNLTQLLHIEASRLAAAFGQLKNAGSTGAEFEAANSEALRFARAAVLRGAELALSHHCTAISQDAAYCDRQVQAIQAKDE